MSDIEATVEVEEETKKSLLEQNPNGFVHLHLHTQYSLLDGAIRISDLFDRTKELGMPAVAMTDHGNMFGAIDFYTSAKDAGVKPIIGCEVYITPGSRFDRSSAGRSRNVATQDGEEANHKIHHLVLLCKDHKGYQNLCKIVSQAYLEGFYYKPRADYDLLRKYSEGLIATSACLGGEVGNNFLNDQDDRAVKAILKLKDIFKDDFYLEIMENKLPEQDYVNKKVISYAREHNIQLVATNDCHYLTKEDSTAQEVLLCIQTGKTLADENRMKMSTDEFYFKSPEEMRERFHYAPDACDNTLIIAEKCNIEINWTDDEGRTKYLLPEFEIDTGETADEYFRRVSNEGLESRFEGPHFTKLVKQDNWETELRPQYYERLNKELDLIIQMGFPGYFLIVADFIQWSKDNDIPVGPGRGSGAGSIVAYALLITNIDPLPFNLLFERFINPERISMPDFDVDFCQQGRGQVIDYVTQKYGSEKVSQIITFGTLSAKAVIRDVCRVFDIPYSEADMLAKLIPDELGIKLGKAIEMEPKIQELIETDPKVRQIFKISQRLEGNFRHAGIHAAGVIITDDPIVNYSPVSKGKEDEQVCQYDKNFSELIGLVKFDFLGLKTLTVIKYASNFIKRDKDSNFDIEEIDLEDKNVYDFISEGDTVGVFQLESSGMIDLCKRIMPGTLDDITAINALYRPGPLESGMVDDFIEIKHGRKEMKFPFDELEPVLKDTYGVIVYQEQVMNIARIVAGYTLGMADMLRRAMGKKKVKEMEKHREIFLEGAKERNFDVQIAADLYELMANFAAYGFNKSHAVAYALIAYQTAFLKKYYPAQFFAGLLSTELSNTDKITAYINDAKRFDIEVLPPDVNESLWLFNVVDKNIRFGMGAVKNVGEGAVEELIRERTENGPYEGFINFCERINYKSINKRMIESLIKVGAFDSCEDMNRKTMLEYMEIIVIYGQKRQNEKEMGQDSLFDIFDGDDEISKDPKDSLGIEAVPEFSEKEKLMYESQLMGIYVSGHPMDSYANVMEQLSSMCIANVQDIVGKAPSNNASEGYGRRDSGNKRDLTLSGMISSNKVIMTKKGDKMSFAMLEDLTGKIECIIFPKVFTEYEEMLSSDEPIIIDGYTNLDEEPRKFFPNKIQELKGQTEERVSAVRISIKVDETSSLQINNFKQAVLSYRGSIPVHLIVVHPHGKARVSLGGEFLINPTPQFAAKINDIFRTNCVQFIVDGKLETAI